MSRCGWRHGGCHSPLSFWQGGPWTSQLLAGGGHGVGADTYQASMMTIIVVTKHMKKYVVVGCSASMNIGINGLL